MDLFLAVRRLVHLRSLSLETLTDLLSSSFFSLQSLSLRKMVREMIKGPSFQTRGSVFSYHRPPLLCFTSL